MGVPLWIWAGVRDGARGAQETGEWSWAPMGPWWAPMGPLGPKGAFSPHPLKGQGDNSAHEKWAPEWAPMGPKWAPAGPSVGPSGPRQAPPFGAFDRSRDTAETWDGSRRAG